MSESQEEAKKRALKELEGKNVAHYSVLLSAWIDTRMERDRTLVTLSAAAIGLLVTVLTTVGASSAWELAFFVISIASFLVTIWSALTVYQLNSEHLEASIRGSSQSDPRLRKYDKLSFRAFILGAISALMIGILSASSRYTPTTEVVMPEQSSPDKSGAMPGKKSLDGVENLTPQPNPQTPEQGQGSSENPASSGNSPHPDANNERV